jgi:Cu2+-containing amine oxidase
VCVTHTPSADGRVRKTCPQHSGRERPARSAAVARSVNGIRCALPNRSPSDLRLGVAAGAPSPTRRLHAPKAAADSTTTGGGVGGKHHPLTPLSAVEIAAAVSTLQSSAHFTPTTRIVSVMLSEPSKRAVYDGVKVRNSRSPSCLSCSADTRVLRGLHIATL